MHRKKTHKALIIVSVILVIIVTGFTGSLNISSFKKSYTNSLVSGYSLVAAQYVNKIEYALKYGKPLANFYGLTDMLQEAKQESAGIKNIRIVLKDGTVIYDLAQATVGQKLPQPLLLQNDFTAGDGENVYSYSLYQKDYHIYIPIYDRNEDWAGSMEMIFSESLVNSRTNEFLIRIVGYSLLLCLVAIIILVILLFKFQFITATGDVNRKLVLITITIILSIIQIAFGVINYVVFKKVYTEIAKEYTVKTAALIKKDINQVIGKGVIYQDLNNINQWLNRFLISTPEIERIDITDGRNKIIYSSHIRVRSGPVNPEYWLDFPLQTDINNTTAALNIKLSQKFIKQKLYEIALDMLTVLVTSFIFMIEVMLFLAVVLIKPNKNGNQVSQASEKAGTDAHLVRPLGFLFYFSAFMSMTFIPVLMKELYRPFWGLPENVIFGLPISAELICGALAALLAGYLMGIRGWKPIFFIGLIVFGYGALLSGMARDAITFIIARGIFGAGYGFCLISMQGYANSATGFDSKNTGFSVLTAGSYAGINCGCVLGALLAERIGFSRVFYVTLGTSFLAGAYALLYMKNSIIPKKVKITPAERQERRLIQFLGDRKLWTFCLFIVIPVAVCTMFLEYFLPLYSKIAGVSAADVGRVFLLNGLAVVYLGPLVSKLTGKYLGLKSAVILFAAITAAAMLTFAHFNSFNAACLSAVLLGIAVGFGEASQNNYILSLKTTKRLGEGIAIGFLNVMTKIGQTIGPIVFGLLMILGAAMGVSIVGWTVLGLLLLFVIITSMKQSNPQISNKD